MRRMFVPLLLFVYNLVQMDPRLSLGLLQIFSALVGSPGQVFVLPVGGSGDPVSSVERVLSLQNGVKWALEAQSGAHRYATG